MSVCDGRQVQLGCLHTCCEFGAGGVDSTAQQCPAPDSSMADGRWQMASRGPAGADGVGSCQAGPSFVGVVHSIFQVTALHHQRAESNKVEGAAPSVAREDRTRTDHGQETTTPKLPSSLAKRRAKSTIWETAYEPGRQLMRNRPNSGKFVPWCFALRNLYCIENQRIL